MTKPRDAAPDQGMQLLCCEKSSASAPHAACCSATHLAQRLPPTSHRLLSRASHAMQPMRLVGTAAAPAAASAAPKGECPLRQSRDSKEAPHSCGRAQHTGGRLVCLRHCTRLTRPTTALATYHTAPTIQPHGHTIQPHSAHHPTTQRPPSNHTGTTSNHTGTPSNHTAPTIQPHSAHQTALARENGGAVQALRQVDQEAAAIAVQAPLWAADWVQHEPACWAGALVLYKGRLCDVTEGQIVHGGKGRLCDANNKMLWQ
jgi:hypothetical protein